MSWRWIAWCDSAASGGEDACATCAGARAVHPDDDAATDPAFAPPLEPTPEQPLGPHQPILAQAGPLELTRDHLIVRHEDGDIANVFHRGDVRELRIDPLPFPFWQSAAMLAALAVGLPAADGAFRYARGMITGRWDAYEVALLTLASMGLLIALTLLTAAAWSLRQRESMVRIRVRTRRRTYSYLATRPAMEAAQRLLEATNPPGQ